MNLTLLPLSTLNLQDGLRSCDTTTASSDSLLGTFGDVVVVMVAVTLIPLDGSPLAPDY